MDTAHYDGDFVTTCIWVGLDRLTKRPLFISVMPLYGVGFCLTFFYTRLKADGEKKFSFIG